MSVKKSEFAEQYHWHRITVSAAGGHSRDWGFGKLNRFTLVERKKMLRRRIPLKNPVTLRQKKSRGALTQCSAICN